MGEDPGEGRPSVGDGPAEQDPGGPEEMRARIEETREELGDTVAALNAAGVAEQFTYVSTAGGAFLEWMEGKPLPGVEVLRQK